MGRKFYFWTIVVPLIVLGWIGWGAYRDITEESNKEARTRQHRDRAVLDELARLDAAVKAHPPKTLAEATQIVGSNGWCGRFKAFNELPTATWSFRSDIPEGDTRVWPRGSEQVWGEAVRASVESCDSTAKIRSLSVAPPESVRLPGAP
ncbi:hypothetical protein [Polyangium mundeleinium]|uniref:Uncharacterized protein n=1 Tax=Polyangium mundeleinium TaxID=2995306 RepID=A0ABT5FA13_9BACT|nr:hypothetical protein [Polyangium mundeleinium]MDC0750012.1 hypothetical protein [Polyangium mundeleinium]